MTLRLDDLSFHKLAVTETPLAEDSMVVKRGSAPAIAQTEDRTAGFVISNAAVDRSGDSFVDAKGWQLNDYLLNPVVLWDHNPHEPPVAKAVATYVEDNALKSVAFFPPAASALSESIYKMLQVGLLNACSVGFRPVEWKMSTRTVKLGDFEMRGLDFYKQYLLEWSIVSIPDNPEALREKHKGLDLRPYAAWAEKALDTGRVVTATRDQLEAVYKTLSPERVTSVPKGVLPFKSTPKADENTPWDGPKEVAAASVDDLKVMCAWVDSDNLDVKSSYKLPHHQAAPPHKLVWNGVKAAMGALMGARGGMKVPESDRKAIYNHLSKHYREFDKEPPEFKTLAEIETKAATDVAADDAVQEEETAMSDVKTKGGRMLSAANLETIKTAMGAFDDMKVAHKSLADAHKSAVSFHKTALDHLDKGYAALHELMTKAEGDVNPNPSNAGEEAEEEHEEEMEEHEEKSGVERDPVDGGSDDEAHEDEKALTVEHFKSAFVEAFASPAPQPVGTTKEEILDLVKNVVREITETQIRRARGK